MTVTCRLRLNAAAVYISKNLYENSSIAKMGGGWFVGIDGDGGVPRVGG